MNTSVEIPYGAYWASPFARWQGSLAHLNAVDLAAHVAREALQRRGIDPAQFNFGLLGITVPQKHSFYGFPWLATQIGATNATGPSISQACATSVRVLLNGGGEIAAGQAKSALLVTCDRTSNGPHIYYPAPSAPGGTGQHEDWVMDNFNCDPNGRHAMIQTAENVATKHEITTQEQHDVVLRRGEQYRQALADDRAFQKRYMAPAMEVPSADFRKVQSVLEGDEGVVLSTEAGLAKLRPVLPGGSVTFGGQTHPADGNAGMILTTPDKAREISTDLAIRVRLRGFGSARTERAFMPEAILPAAQMALDQAGLTIGEIDAVNSHNPFAVNDILFSRETGFPLEKMNNFGCSLIWGHPQGPTGMRAIIELIEELAMRGGGTGLFQGCAAGDSAMACVVEVSDR